MARIRTAEPKARPELTAAMAAGGDTSIQIAIIPSTTQRRSIEESMAVLPRELGGGPITTLTQGLTLDLPHVGLRAQAGDPRRRASKGCGCGEGRAGTSPRTASISWRKRCQNDPALASLTTPISQMKPLAQGDRITLEADLEKTAELVAVPIRQAREAARRVQCVNNLKQIGLAMHNYHSTHNTFPPAYNKGPDGKPLLSWRVHILPYLEQEALYKEFHQDEPWDSEHNKALIARMPATYTCPSGSGALANVAKEGKTSYLTPRGPATIFPGAEGIKIQDITDGTSNTILVVDANDAAAVTWTKPDDWDIAVELQGPEPCSAITLKGTNSGFADGSVHFLKDSISSKLLQDLTTRNGGEVISSDDL